jgi:spermidine/putrescine-binding protein
MRYGRQSLKADTVVVAGSLITLGMSSAGAASNSQPRLKSLKGQTLVIMSWGAAWTQAEQKYPWGLFTESTGIKVQSVINGSDPSIPATPQEATSNISIDLVEPLDPAMMINRGETQHFPSWLQSSFKFSPRPTTYTKNYVQAGGTATIVACNPAVMKKCPPTPAEFFDVKNYPTEANPTVLEALGQTSSQLAGALDMPKAMKELQKIKGNISSWPNSVSRMQQLFLDKLVGAEIMWNGRASILQQIDEEADLVVVGGEVRLYADTAGLVPVATGEGS